MIVDADERPAGWGPTLFLLVVVPALAAGLLFGAGFWVGRASAPDCPQAPAPSLEARTTSVASSSSAVGGKQRAKIIYTPSQARHVGEQQADRGGLRVVGTPKPSEGLTGAPGSFEIILEQEVGATSSASSVATSSAELSTAGDNPGDNPARLGVMVAYPVGLAVTYQLGALELPKEAIGVGLDLGVDLEGNLDQLGAGMSLGRKAFVAGGGFVGWRGPLYGWYLGVGQRF